MAEKENRTVTDKASSVWKSRPVAWASAVILVLAVLVAAVSIGLSIFAPVNEKGESMTPPVLPSASSTSKAEPSAQSGPCNVPLGDKALRPSVPKDLSWGANQGLTWPVSDTYGPTKAENGFGVCFARSPLGAALAATSILYSQYNGHSPKEMLEFYVVDSPGKQAAVSEASSESSAGEFAKMGTNAAGFIVDEFTSDRASVTLVFTLPQSDTGYMGLQYTVVWVDDDWRLKIPDNSVNSKATKPVEGQFVEWTQSNG